MTQKEFIKGVFDIYRKARKLPKKYKGNNIERRTNRIVSSNIEDFFAYYCSQKIKQIKRKKIKILVDPHLTFPNNKKMGVFRPDVCIVKNNIVKLMVELKTDLGYKRKEFWTSYLKKEHKNIDDIKKARLCKNADDFLKISRRLRWFCVVLSTENMGGNKFRKVKKLKNHGVLFLSSGMHPNAKTITKTQFMEQEVDINFKDFEKIDKILARI